MRVHRASGLADRAHSPAACSLCAMGWLGFAPKNQKRYADYTDSIGFRRFFQYRCVSILSPVSKAVISDSMKKQRPRVLFVYNVDLTPFALLSDFVHRIVSPDTYPCRLCDLTYDRFTMKGEWKRFIASLPVDCGFELRDRFQRKYPAYADVPLPALFRSDGRDKLVTLLSADEINGAKTIEALRQLVAAAVRK
jgi:hypothetical protein